MVVLVIWSEPLISAPHSPVVRRTIIVTCSMVVLNDSGFGRKMAPNQFLTSAADPIGHDSAYLRSQGRSLNNRRADFRRRRGPRLCGAEAGRLRLLYQRQWTSG